MKPASNSASISVQSRNETDYTQIVLQDLQRASVSAVSRTLQKSQISSSPVSLPTLSPTLYENINHCAVGQASYNSTITMQGEMLPVSVDIIAAKGCDGMIFALAKELLDIGILKIPTTGSVPFP